MTVFKTLAACLTLAPAAALACSPSPATVTSAPVQTDQCAVHWAQDEYRTVGLGPVTDLGGFLVMQSYFDGNACYWDSGLVVQDCATGEAVVIGPEQRALMDGPRETGIDRIEKALIETGGGVSLDKSFGLALAAGYDAPRELPEGAPLHIGGVTLPRDCACKTLYPEKTGGTE